MSRPPRTARIVRFTRLLPEYEEVVQALAAEVRSGKLHVWLTHFPAGDLLVWYVLHDVGVKYAFDRETILGRSPSLLVSGLEHRFTHDILTELWRQPQPDNDEPVPEYQHTEFTDMWNRRLHRGF